MMQTAAKGEVAVVCTSEVEVIRTGELLWVPVGGAQAGHDAITSLDHLAIKLKVADCDTGDQLHGAVEAKEFLHCRVGEFRLLLPLAIGLRMM